LAFSQLAVGRQNHRSLATPALELDATSDVASHQISALAAKNIAFAVGCAAITGIGHDELLPLLRLIRNNCRPRRLMILIVICIFNMIVKKNLGMT
jgi:hypothetical protein